MRHNWARTAAAGDLPDRPDGQVVAVVSGIGSWQGSGKTERN
jgi:hypothetical protein